MAVSSRKKIDRSVNRVISHLQKTYGGEHAQAEIEAYRFNPSSIRIRITDPDFRGVSRLQRDKIVSPLLEALPEDIRADITVLLLITPEEKARSLMSLEFDDPRQSRL
jgi:stress-induced morphogen